MKLTFVNDKYRPLWYTVLREVIHLDKEQIVRLLQSFADKYVIRIGPEMLGIAFKKTNK